MAKRKKASSVLASRRAKRASKKTRAKSAEPPKRLKRGPPSKPRGRAVRPAKRSAPKRSVSKRPGRALSPKTRGRANVGTKRAERPVSSAAKHKLELRAAEQGERLADTQRQIGRIKGMSKAPKRNRAEMEYRLHALKESADMAAERLQLPPESVRGYFYEDGKVIARIRIPFKPNVPIHEQLIDAEEALILPGGKHFIEMNALYRPDQVPRDDKGKVTSALWKFKGSYRLQFWGSHVRGGGTGEPITGGPGLAFFNLRTQIEQNQAKGFGLPDQIYVRIGDTIDQSQPFRRIRPPKGGTRMGKRRPKLPKS